MVTFLRPLCDVIQSFRVYTTVEKLNTPMANLLLLSTKLCMNVHCSLIVH